MGIVSHIDDEYALVWIFRLVVMFNDIKQSACHESEDNFLERDVSVDSQFIILVGIPIEVLHRRILLRCVPFVNMGSSCGSFLQVQRHNTPATFCDSHDITLLALRRRLLAISLSTGESARNVV